MADKGIIFSAPMVRALLDGRKTQTRRLIKPTTKELSVGQRLVTEGPRFGGTGYRFIEPYSAGDQLYVREHWKTSRGNDGVAPRDLDPITPVLYLADGAESGRYPVGAPGQHRQGMHMPRWASRLWLAVTDVRVQRLQDINEADAIAEGIESAALTDHWKDYGGDPLPFSSPVESYKSLWNSLHAAPGTTWADNPWIVAVTFDVHQGNING